MDDMQAKKRALRSIRRSALDEGEGGGAPGLTIVLGGKAPGDEGIAGPPDITGPSDIDDDGVCPHCGKGY